MPSLCSVSRILLFMSFIFCCLLTHNAQAVVGEDWQWINPYPSGNTVQDVIWDGGQFISVSTDVKPVQTEKYGV